MSKVHFSFEGVSPETAIRIKLLRTMLGIKSYELLNMMVSDLWEKHKDKLTTYDQGKATREAKGFIQRVFDRKGEYIKKNERTDR